MQRRLAAIVAADISEFSRLVSEDEEGTLSAQHNLQIELIDPLLEQYGGRVANTAGDSLLIEFPSAIEAVRSAIAIQDGIALVNADIPAGTRIEYRIGINVGDVIGQENGDLLGEGVNIAARLEALAAPGGIVISRAVRDQIRDRMDVDLDDLGEIEVKNIPRPVRAFSILRDGESRQTPQPRRPFKNSTRLAMVAVLLVVAFGAWFALSRSDQTGAAGFDAKELLAESKGPRVAVLPFLNKGDPDDDFFAEGMRSEILSNLGYYQYLTLLAGTATEALPEKERDPVHLGQSIQADYVLEGAVRRAADRARISAQLFSGTSGAQIWSETFDVELSPEKLFDIQSDIANRVAIAVGDRGGAITRETAGAVRGKPPEDLADYECIFYTFGDWYRPGYLEKAFPCALALVERDPSNARALSYLSLIYQIDAWHHFGISRVTPDEAARLTLQMAERAVKANPRDQTALRRLAMAHSTQRDRERFQQTAERVFAMGWRSNFTMGWLGTFYARSGKWDVGLAIVRKAISLSPGNYPLDWHIAFADEHLIHGRFEDHLKELRILEVPDFYLTHLDYATIFGLMERLEEAKTHVDALLKKRPDYTMARAAKMFEMESQEARLIKIRLRGLRAAGLPEGDYDGRYDE